MYAADGQAGAALGGGCGDLGGAGFGSVAEALRAGVELADFLNSPAAAEVSGAACGEVLTALGEIQGKLAAAYAAFLRRFDAADAHNADGYGSTSAWLAAKGQLTRKDARTAVRLVCQYHHDVCIHRQGWQLTLHPDGTTEARSPDGRQVLYSHAPPGQHAA